MSGNVATLLEEFQRLTPSERAEFLAATLKPKEDYGEWADTDVALVAAQTFARLDAEESNVNGAN